MPAYKRAQLPTVIREKRLMVRKTWAKKPTIKRFLREHAPIQWNAIRTCSLEYRPFEDKMAPGVYKLLPISCHEIPWCIICTQRQDFFRTQAAMDRFSLCTAAKRPLLHAHAVQTAPIYDDGTGWGNDASRDLTSFFRIVWDTCREILGDGLGGTFSYHDLGEQSFAKRHPHIDFSLNGYRIQDGAADKLTDHPQGHIYDTAGPGYARWQATVAQLARDHWPDAKTGNLKLQPVRDGPGALHKTLSYQLRTIIDFRKAEYHPGKQLVAWSNYKTGAWTYLPVLRVLAGIAEQEARLGSWTKEGRELLHRSFGHMADRTFHTTAAQVGGTVLPHGIDCTCKDCRDWEEVILKDVDRDVGLAKPLDWDMPSPRIAGELHFGHSDERGEELAPLHL